MKSVYEKRIEERVASSSREDSFRSEELEEGAKSPSSGENYKRGEFALQEDSFLLGEIS